MAPRSKRRSPVLAGRASMNRLSELPKLLAGASDSIIVSVVTPKTSAVGTSPMTQVVGRLKLAVTARSASITTMHCVEPVHAPVQPSKVAPGSGVGVSVTGVRATNRDAHESPQSIPAGPE